MFKNIIAEIADEKANLVTTKISDYAVVYKNGCDAKILTKMIEKEIIFNKYIGTKSHPKIIKAILSIKQTNNWKKLGFVNEKDFYDGISSDGKIKPREELDKYNLYGPTSKWNNPKDKEYNQFIDQLMEQYTADINKFYAFFGDTKRTYGPPEECIQKGHVKT